MGIFGSALRELGPPKCFKVFWGYLRQKKTMEMQMKRQKIGIVDTDPGKKIY